MESVCPEEELGTPLFLSLGRCCMMTYRNCCGDITPCPLSPLPTSTTLDQTAWQPERHSLGLPRGWTLGLTTSMLVAVVMIEVGLTKSTQKPWPQEPSVPLS